MDAAAARALVANHHVFDASTFRVVGGPDTPDPRVQMQLLGASTAVNASSVGWRVATGAAVHASAATYGESWTASSVNDFTIFAVDGRGAQRGITSGTSAASTPGAAASASLFVLTNLYGGPDLAGYAFDSGADPTQDVSFAHTGLALNIAGTKVYALSTQGDLYCLTGFSGGPKTAPAARLSPCDGGAHWPYSAGVGHTVSWSTPYPVYLANGDVSALYFGDDAGALHCVNAVTYTDASGVAHTAGTSCWAGGPAPLVSTPGDCAALSGPVVISDPAAGTPVVFIGDERGRFFRVVDRGTTPVAGPGIAQESLCRGAASVCNAAPYFWAIHGGPTVDYQDNLTFVVTAGTSSTGAPVGAIAAQFSTSASANWQQSAPAKTLTSATLNGPVDGSPVLDLSNGWIYSAFQNSLHKAKVPFDGSVASGVYETPLVGQVTAPPAGLATDSFPLGYVLPYFNPPYYDAIYVANTGRIEEYGCQAAGEPPVLEGVSATTYPGVSETGFVIDWANGNLYFGLDDGANGGGFVQHPSTASPGAWSCPSGYVGGPAAACGAAGCAPSCSNCLAVGGDTVQCDVSTGNVCAVQTCPPGRADCDNNAANGCEIDIGGDVENCGGCASGAPPQVGSPHQGLACSSNHATPVCANGTCGGSCDPGYGRCAGDAASNGCAVKVTCGKPSAGAGCCNANCGPGQACLSVAGGPSQCTSAGLPVACATVSEHSTATIACAEPDQVITAIQFVSFGLPVGTCGAFTTGAIPVGGTGVAGTVCDAAFVETAPLAAGKRGTPLDGKHSRSTETALQLVENMCLGRSSCGVLADSATPQGPAPERQLGDPCPGNDKRLYVQYTCGCPQCESDADCGPQAPHCNTAAHACGCASDGDCTTPGRTHCDATTAQCVACAGDAQCAAKTYCDTTPDGTSYGDVTPGAAAHTCAPCVANADCTAPTPVCDTTATSPTAYACVACVESSDCGGATPVCDPASKTCVTHLCGDGLWDPATEECDEGEANADGNAPCSASCTIQDFLAAQGAPARDGGVPLEVSRTLGEGRHPVVAGPGGFAVAMLEEQGTVALRVEAFDLGGKRVASFPSLGTPSQLTLSSDPVVSPIGANSYAVAWTDVGGDGDDQGIALTTVDVSTGVVGTVQYANQVTRFAQHGADAIWTGTSLVAAWTDESDPTTGANLKLRTFGPTLAATSGELDLAATTATESDVALATFNGSWAAAWRAGAGGSETIHVRTAAGAEYTVGPFAAGPSGERPAIVQAGPTRLLVAFTSAFEVDDAGASSTKLTAALVDTSAPAGPVSFFDWPVDGVDAAGMPIFPQAAPAVAVAGETVWAASWTGALPGTVNGEDIWQAPLDRANPVVGVAAPISHAALHRQGDQRLPALAVTSLGVNGALVAAWDDCGGTLAPKGGATTRDVVMALTPLVAGGRAVRAP